MPPQETCQQRLRLQAHLLKARPVHVGRSQLQFRASRGMGIACNSFDADARVTIRQRVSDCGARRRHSVPSSVRYAVMQCCCIHVGIVCRQQ